MEATNFGKWIIFAGFFLVLVGLVVWLGAKSGLPFGKLPGDLYLKGKHTIFYFPLVTGLIISVILTVIINLIYWILKK